MSGNNLTFKDFTIDYDKTRGGKVIYWSDRGIDLKTKRKAPMAPWSRKDLEVVCLSAHIACSVEEN